MNQCMQSFFDFCPSDRLTFILICLALVFIGYVIGTDGHWNRFYWKTPKTSKPKEDAI